MEFGTWINLIITLTVALYGVYWLLSPGVPLEQATVAYRYRAYCYWWCSWLAWVFAWSLLLLKQFYQVPPGKYILGLEIPILIFDNLNSILLMIVYLVLTRGSTLTSREAGIRFIQMVLSATVFFLMLYSVFSALDDREFAYEIHQTCSLCVAVSTPFLVGWAFRLRFKTTVVLTVGCVYGFIQPIVYATQLHVFQQGSHENTIIFIRPIVAMMVGGLKVVWAITCTKFLSSAHASARNIIREETREAPSLFEQWWPSVSLHATILIFIYSTLLIWLLIKNKDNLGSFGLAIGILTSVISFFQMIWNVYRRTRKLPVRRAMNKSREAV